MNINDYVEMTREDFIVHANNENLCPIEFDLNILPICTEGDDVSECNECWNNALKDIEFFNPVVAFQNSAVTILDDLHLVEQQYQQLEEGRKHLKDKLMMLMEHHRIDKFENDKLSITYVKGTTGTSFDSTKFKKEHKDLYEEYQKSSIRAASVRFKVK